MSDEKIDEITDGIYRSYGSGTGVLFGIPSNLRGSVRAIVELVCNIFDEEINKQTALRDTAIKTCQMQTKEVERLEKEHEELMKSRFEVESKIIEKLLVERNMLINHIKLRNKKDKEFKDAVEGDVNEIQDLIERTKK